MKSLAGLCILVVDDNGSTRLLLRKWLLDRGMEPTIEDDGAKALEALRRDRFKVVILDARKQSEAAQTFSRRSPGNPDLLVGESCSSGRGIRTIRPELNGSGLPLAF